MSEPRKATDVLASVEAKVEVMLGIVRSQDLNIKVLSNKLNELMKKLEEQPPNKIIVETVQTAPKPPDPAIFPQLQPDPERSVPIMADASIPQTQTPEGFRRTSRPETYVDDKAPLVLLQSPDRSIGEIPSQSNARKIDVPKAPPIAMIEQPIPTSAQGQIPVMQRCVNKDGKSIFLAEVEVVDLNTKQQVFKGRSNATGKWMNSFPKGIYRAIITKRESLTKEKLEAAYDFKVSGSEVKMELPNLVIK
jgi:hypothetical protein